MRRDFTQQFTKAKATRVYILAEDTASGKFLVFRSFDDDKDNDGYYSEEFHYLPYLDFTSQDSLVLRLAEFLYTRGLALNSLRKVARETNLSFSLVDDTPGEESDTLCVHVIADQINPPKQQDNLEALFMHLPELSRLADVTSSSHVVRYGLAKICMERGLPIDFM